MSKPMLITLAAAILIFSGSLLFGAVLISYDPEIGDAFMETIAEALQIEELMEDPPSVLALKLFINNLQACIIIFLGGVTFGLLTAFVLALNGFIVGIVAQISLEVQGALFVIAALAPHGIVELPALFIAGALGFMLAGALHREWNGDGDAAQEALVYANTFAKTVVPLLAIAAVTEAFITPAVIVMLV